MKWLFFVKMSIYLFIYFLFSFSTAYAACLGAVPVWGTGDDRASCADKKQLKKEEQRLKIERKKIELELERQNINRGIGSGSGNTNVILGSLNDLINGQSQVDESHFIKPFSRHQIRIESMPWVIPGAYQFDKPGMPENYLLTGAAWEYFLNKNLGIGFLWQEWSKQGGRDFDPVMTRQRDGSGDTAVFFPGNINRLKYKTHAVYATINAELASDWISILRLGMGRTQVDVEYSDIDRRRHPYAHLPRDGEHTYIDSATMMGGIAIEYLTDPGTRIGGEIRYINARHDTSDYITYLNMGSVQVLFYVQFMLTPLGLL